MIRRHFFKFAFVGLAPIAPRPVIVDTPAIRAGVKNITIPAGRVSQLGTILFAFPEPPAVQVTALVDAGAAGYSPDELVGLTMPSAVLTAVSHVHADVVVTRLNPDDTSGAQIVQVHWQATRVMNEVAES